MADVFFHYLRWAFDPARRRNVVTSRQLLAADVERIIQTAAFRVRLVARYHDARRTRERDAASAAERKQFFEQAAPEPRPPEVLEEKTERFPIHSTLTLGECDRCQGSGRLKCEHCDGRLKILCTPCGGMGNDRGMICGTCYGRGAVRCTKCSQGTVPDDVCNGEGRLATWTEEVHTQWGRAFELSHAPKEATSDKVQRAIGHLLTHDHSPSVAELSRAAAVAHLGYDTPELAEILDTLERHRDLLQHRALAEPSDHITLLPEVRLVPVQACVVRLLGATEPLQYWRIGTGEHAIEIGPTLRTTFPARAVLPFVAAVAAGSLLQPVMGLAGVGLAAVAAVGLVHTSAAQVYRQPVSTIVFVHCSSRPSVFLRLLVSLGACVQAFEVTGRGYRAHLEALLNESGPHPQVWSVVVKLPSGTLLRLCEVRQPEQLSSEARRALLELADGFILLETPEASGDVLQHSGLADKFGSAPRLLLSSDAGTCDAEGLAPGGGIAIEALRRAFVREADPSLDWKGVFARCWAPIRQLLTPQQVSSRTG